MGRPSTDDPDLAEAAFRGKRFGDYLRRIREDRNLSLDAVEEQSLGYPERVTKSHLSRIETGKATPTFPRVYALSRIYGVPITQLAERFELDLRTDTRADSDVQRQGTDPATTSAEELLARGKELCRVGHYSEALMLFEVGLERTDRHRHGRDYDDLWIGKISALIHLDSFHSAKDEAEQFLAQTEVAPQRRAMALYFVAFALHRLGRSAMAEIIVAELHQCLQSAPEEQRLQWLVHGLDGSTRLEMRRYREAAVCFHQAATVAEAAGATVEVVRQRLNQVASMIEVGQLSEAQRIVSRVLTRCKAERLDRLTALALSHLALICYRRGRIEDFEGYALQSNRLARETDLIWVIFRNSYYLMLMAEERGDQATHSSCLRSLKTYVNRIGKNVPERDKFIEYMKRSDA